MSVVGGAAVPASSHLSPNQSPDHSIAAAILVSLQNSAVPLTLEDLVQTLEHDNEEQKEEEEEPGSQLNPIVIEDLVMDNAEDSSLHTSIERSVRQAYETFIQTLGDPVDAVQPLVPLSPSGYQIVPLSTGGYSYASPLPSTPHQLSLAPPVSVIQPAARRRSRRAMATLSLSQRPLLRQTSQAPSSSPVRRRQTTRESMANHRLARFARQLRGLPRGLARSYTINMSCVSAGEYREPTPISSFVLTADIGIPDKPCAVCLEEYKQGERLSYVACQPVDHSKDHLFHTQCIESWISSLRRGGNYVRTCPVCRGEF